MTNTFLRNGFLALLVGLLLSCGGGGGGGGAGGAGAGFVSAGSSSAGASPASGDASTAAGIASDGQSNNASATSGASASGGTSGVGGPGGSDGSSGGGAPGGAGATGSSGASGGGSGGTATAGSGDDGSGVGSGGTGVSTADAAGIGAVDGAGSIIVNGLRYDTDTAVFNVEDAPALQLGMSAKVTGPVNADFTSGTARRVESAADVRGALSSVDLGQGSFVILGTTITTDEATVWADLAGLAAVAPGSTLQVWGLPGAPGVLRATRVEQQHGGSAPILTGTVQNLDSARRTFTIGGMVVEYGAAVLSGSPDGGPLTNGTLVRVRANTVQPGRLSATLVQWWYPVPTANSAVVQLAGIVNDYAGLGSLRVLNVPVNASAAKVTGGPASAIGNGVKVEVAGVMSNGVLQASKLKIRHVPGTGGPPSFLLIGTVGNFSSVASFRVRGQPVDASGPGVAFVNGSAANLRNGVKVNIEGSQVVNGVLVATRVGFE